MDGDEIAAAGVPVNVAFALEEALEGFEKAVAQASSLATARRASAIASLQ